MKAIDGYYYSIMYDNALIESVIRIQLFVAVFLLSNLVRLALNEILSFRKQVTGTI